MNIVMIASECAPVAKVGGLGDVIYGLSRELALRGNTVEVILPKYDCMQHNHIQDLTISFQDLWVPWNNGAIRCTVWSGEVLGLRCHFIESHSQEHFFNRGGFYGYPDEAMRFAFFSKASLEFLLKTEKRPDIIHCHDWQAALVPVLLYEVYQQAMPHQRVCYTIHNFRHQGIVGADILTATGLNRPEYYVQPEKLRDDFNPHALNLMKGAIVYSNFITTVSPQHAWEVRNTEQSYGLGNTLHAHQNKFSGVLNGLDYEVWNPNIDPLIPAHYSVDNLQPKYENKRILREQLLLRKDFKPIIAYVGRLDAQKGVHLIRHGLFYALWNNAQFVLLGSSPERGINDYFWHLKHYLNDNPDCHLEIGFNEELAHLIYAGADMLIVPSIYEPCGLTQMIGLRYGTVPIVRPVGGLADTVFDRDNSDKPFHERNGYIFQQDNYAGLESAMSRAIGLWHDYPDDFHKLIDNGMRADHSWNISGQHYLNIYEYIKYK